MSLINGMDSIMTHIKNQEILIKKLNEENQKLKNDVESAEDVITQLNGDIDNLKEENAELDSTMKGAMDSFMMAQNSYNKLKVVNDKYNNLKFRVDNFKQMLKDTADLEEDEEGWMETWDIIEDTLGIDSRGNDIA